MCLCIHCGNVSIINWEHQDKQFVAQILPSGAIKIKASQKKRTQRDGVTKGAPVKPETVENNVETRMEIRHFHLSVII